MNRLGFWIVGPLPYFVIPTDLGSDVWNWSLTQSKSMKIRAKYLVLKCYLSWVFCLICMDPWVSMARLYELDLLSSTHFQFDKSHWTFYENLNELLNPDAATDTFMSRPCMAITQVTIRETLNGGWLRLLRNSDMQKRWGDDILRSTYIEK